MTATRPMLRDSALALPVLALLGAWFGGPVVAAGVVASGIVSIANLALLGWLVERMVAIAAAGGTGAGPAVLILLKMGLVLGAFALLLAVFPPLSVALGTGAAIAGVTTRGLVESLRIPEHEEVV